MTDCGKRILSSSGPRPSDRQIDAVAQGQRSRMAKKSATGASPRSTEPSRNVTEMPDAVDTMATISATGRLLSPMAISVPSMTMSFDAMSQNLASGFIYCSLKSFSNGNITVISPYCHSQYHQTSRDNCMRLSFVWIPRAVHSKDRARMDKTQGHRPRRTDTSWGTGTWIGVINLTRQAMTSQRHDVRCGYRMENPLGPGRVSLLYREEYGTPGHYLGNCPNLT